MKLTFIVSTIVLLLCGCFFQPSDVGACYLPSYIYYDYYDLYTSTTVKPRPATSKIRTTISSKTSTMSTEMSTMMTTKKTCNIWCWIRKVGLFIVQQLLSDDD